jgi:AraC-like DNA-binding protein
MITTITNLNIGFSIVTALLLLLSYAFFIPNNNKSTLSIIVCALFLFGITALQFEHLSFIQLQADPLDTVYYRFLLFFVPPTFYFLARLVLFSDYQLSWLSSLHFAPLFSVFFIEKEIAVPAAFMIGTGYCLWLSHILYSLRQHRKRFEIEFFFFAFFSLLAIAVLIFGFLVSYIDNAYFYWFYANGIGLAFVLVTGALIVYPDLLNELTDAVKLSYNHSTLTNIDLEQNIEKLRRLMQVEKIYQNDALNLTLLAESMALTVHQLSELINTQFAVSFSRYIRMQRVEAAKLLLIDEPGSSILAISIETGFKSQSNFYAAFKEMTGQSPGGYRKKLR